MKNLTLSNITKVCGGIFRGDETLLSQEAADVVIDSRKATPGCLFVAIDGERVNAHRFIPDTIAKGALCVVSHEDLGETDYPYILVKSTGQALLDIAKLYRDSLDIKVVGITGSAGKTSTKEMIASVLSRKYRVHKTPGNFNNEWGLPLTIFSMPEDTEVAVLEMGVNHFGEMRRLSSVAQPDICVVSNIGIAHLEFFGTREGILREKTEMFQDMKDGGTVLLNGDDDLLRTVGPVKGLEPVYFGMEEGNAIRAADIRSLGLRGSSCTISLPDRESFSCTVPIPGVHMVSNALAGAAAGYVFGLSPDEIRAGIEGFSSLPGRNNIISTEKLMILDDCYNSNPVSLRAALDVLSLSIGRRVAILGDMGELGGDSDRLHYETGQYAGKLGIEVVCGIGDLTRELVRGASEQPGVKALWFASKDDFYAQMKELIETGDNILVKASHSMGFPEIVERLRAF